MSSLQLFKFTTTVCLKLNRSMGSRRYLVVAGSLAGVAAASAGYAFDQRDVLRARFGRAVAAADHAGLNTRPVGPLPSRNDLMQSIMAGDEFDILVIGGGATGSGVALDAQTRGLKTALVEINDFSSGTSSKSTKLIHGGVRYLQAAIMRADREQYRMVKEALFERHNLLQIAPHLAFPLPIMLPVYKWWQVPYYWAGIKMYDLVAYGRTLKSSYYITKSRTLELFPMLKSKSLCGSLIYYDGQHDDARMNIAITVSAIRQGATCLNHTEAVRLLKDDDGKVVGARVRDLMTVKEFDVRAKCVINATGPFTDNIRLDDDPSKEKICQPSQGVHITLPGYYSPTDTGLLDPSTKDGRVIFFLPWERFTIAGTTDSPTDLTYSPTPKEKDIEFILEEIRAYLSADINVRRGDVLSAWAGLRPLVKDPNKANTAALARNHIIEVSDSGLITIAGGKWTTYRHMAEETVDRALQVHPHIQPARPCMTAGLLLEGAHNFTQLQYISLVQDFGLEVDVAQHLSNTYGDRARSVAKAAKFTGQRWPIVGRRIHPEFPFLEAEVEYAVREYATTIVDVIARRLRIAFLNTHAAAESLEKIADIMGAKLNWSKSEKKAQVEAARDFLDTEMGAGARQSALSETPIALTKVEREKAMGRFKELDSSGKGYVSVNDLRTYFLSRGQKIDEALLHQLLNEVDINRNGVMDMMEFLQLWSGLVHGTVSALRFQTLLQDQQLSEDFKKRTHET